MKREPGAVGRAMLRSGWLVLLFALAGCAAAAHGTRAGPGANTHADPLEIVPVPGTDGHAWRAVHHHPVADGNSLIYVTADGVPVLADTPWSNRATRELVAWVERCFGRLPAVATINHFHLDASGGVEALRDAGVPVVASTHTVELMRERLPAMRQELGLPPSSALPDVTFEPDAGWRGEVGSEEVQVLFVGGGHTADNVVTWFPTRRLLFAGCMVKGGESLGYLGDADLEAYPDSVARLEALAPRTVVVGHGARTDPAQLRHTRELAEAARSTARSAALVASDP